MNLAALLSLLLKVAPVALQLADEFKLNVVAADMLRKVAADLVAAAKKTATPIDDMLAAIASSIIDHIADLLAQGLVKEAEAVIAACQKTWPPA